MAQLKDLIVTGASRFIGDVYANKLQLTSLSAPTTAGGTTYGVGTSGNYLRSNGTSLYWDALDAADIPNLDASKITSGTLGVARGGTGASSFTANSIIMSGNSTTAALTTRAITNNTSATAIATGTNIPTMNTIYYGLPTINNSHTYTSSTTIYAPTAGGTLDTHALVGAGTTTAPKWVEIAPSITITAGTGSATPKVNVTVLGRSGTAQAITTASTSVYGATKLSSTSSSSEQGLAATPKLVYDSIANLDFAEIGVAAATGNKFVCQISETDGKISATLSSATIGGAAKPVYVDSGVIKNCSSTVGSGTQPVYMSSGTITASTSTVGSILKPTYLNAGTTTISSGSTIPFIAGPSTDTTAGTWTATLIGITAYADGLLILYKPAIAGASTTTLNLNSLGAKTVYINNTTKLTTHFPVNQPILLVYSTSQNSGCWMCLDNYWTNTVNSAGSTNSTSKLYLIGATSQASSATTYSNSAVYATNGELTATKVYGAVWNDYAEYRNANVSEPGRVVQENGNDTLRLADGRLLPGCEIVSDTFGFAIGETEQCGTPVAATGRVLAYPYEDRELFRSYIGAPVCSGPNGTVSIMTEEEEMKYPSRIIGTISAVPDYEEWGTNKVKVNGRVWIRIR